MGPITFPQDFAARGRVASPCFAALLDKRGCLPGRKPGLDRGYVRTGAFLTQAGPTGLLGFLLTNSLAGRDSLVCLVYCDGESSRAGPTNDSDRLRAL